MANHCWNTMSITQYKDDDKQKIIDFFKSYENYDYLTHWGDSLLKPEDRTVGEITMDNCYKWGSRWWEFDLDVGDDYIQIDGDSAWSPMCELASLISEVFECHVNLDYSEPGMDFAGIENYKDGAMIDIQEFTYREYEYKFMDSHYHVQKIIEDIRDACYESETLEDFLHSVSYLNKSHKDEVQEEFAKQLKINT